MAKTVNDNTDANSVIDYDVTSFLYSKHQAEDELKLVESKLRDNGIPFEEYDGTKSLAWSNTLGNKSTTSEQTKQGKGEKCCFQVIHQSELCLPSLKKCLGPSLSCRFLGYAVN